MQVQKTDFNDAGSIIDTRHTGQWQELYDILSRMPLFVKASDQTGKQGSVIFDPVGTNSYIRDRLIEMGWMYQVTIPSEFNFLGTDIDFAKEGALLEVQFSNYPFLLNNVLRSEILYKAKTPIEGGPTELVFIVTKAHMFPASNSTLYYEQARHQIDALTSNKVIEVPIRLVGVFEEKNTITNALYTEYMTSRYSRIAKDQKNIFCKIIPGKSEDSRCKIEVLAR